MASSSNSCGILVLWKITISYTVITQSQRALQANTGNKLYIQKTSEEKCRQDRASAAEEKSVDFLDTKNSARLTEGAVHQASFSVWQPLLTDLAAILKQTTQKRTHFDSRWLNESAQSWIYLTDSDATRRHHSKHRAVRVTFSGFKTSTGAVVTHYRVWPISVKL